MSNEHLTETASCDFCVEPMAYWANNNESALPSRYCETCEEKRSEKFGCAMLIEEGATCEDGICGCGGTGVY
jgi:hypothetical protein